jgi:hypothetical protein
MEKVKHVSQEDKEWIIEYIQVIRKIIKKREERQKRKVEI